MASCIILLREMKMTFKRIIFDGWPKLYILYFECGNWTSNLKCFLYLKVNGMVSQEVTTFPIELSTVASEAVEAETVQGVVLSLRQLNCIQSLLKTLQRILSFSMDWRSLLCTKSCFRWVRKNCPSCFSILAASSHILDKTTQLP